MKKTYLITLVLSGILTACVSHKNPPPIETFSLDISSGDAPVLTTTHPPIIRMMPATISAPFSNSFFIYRISSAQYLTDPYRRFLATPNSEITSYLEHHMKRNLHGSLISVSNLSGENYILQENIEAIYADYQNKATPFAVIAIHFILYATQNGKIREISSLSIQKESAVEPNNPNDLINGYMKNLREISQQATEWINRKIST